MGKRGPKRRSLRERFDAKWMPEPKSQARMVREHGLHAVTISKIVRRETWKEVG